jgi:hypothetical protein
LIFLPFAIALPQFAPFTTENDARSKVVEQAVQYAQGLGFAPHPDYKKAARVFGGLRAEQCSQKFTFGHKGKPLYRRAAYQENAP